VLGIRDFVDWPEIVLAIAGAFVAYFVEERYRRRANARDHVAEVPRDVTIPPECAGCASARAPFAAAVIGNPWLTWFPWKRWLGGSATSDAVKRNATRGQTFLFHFCIHCSRALRRHRRFGSVVTLAGFCLLLAIPASIVLVSFSESVRRLAQRGPTDWFFWSLILSVFAAPLLIATGIMIHQSTPGVSILEAGEKTIFFSFRNQNFRDIFGRLNGRE
jgi:hypothetical protein